MQENTGRRLLRFGVAGFTAILMVLVTLLFMRYLITGYDRSASAALTRYISVPSLTITRSKAPDIERITRPAALPDTPVIDEEDVQTESSEFIEESTLAFPEMTAPENNMNEAIRIPELQSAPSGERNKMNELKEAILNAGE